MTQRAWMDDEDYQRRMYILAYTSNGQPLQIAEYRGEAGLEIAMIRAYHIAAQWPRVTVVEQVHDALRVTHFDSAESEA